MAEIADLPVQKQTAEMWRRLNGLERLRPMVWINEIPWHEMNLTGELSLQTSDPFCREVEEKLRQTIYLWEHLRVDMVVESKFYSPLVIHDTGFGIKEKVDFIRQDPNSSIVSRQYYPQIREEKDLEQIKPPMVTHDEAASERNYQTLLYLFGDILTIEKCGIVHRWFAPWDALVSWWGVQQAVLDLVLRPELVHLAMARLIEAHLSRLEQWEELNLLSLTEGNYRVGSGALGYTYELPQSDFDPQHVRPCDQWGCATAQIFSDVSPEMHQEFALRYETRWLERFGLNYYGCCEPLHHKIDILETIPNLRKISVSPWSDVDRAVDKIGTKFVFSYKPNPAVLAADAWNPDQARKKLVEVFEKTQGCVVEVIMKDISTVCYQPQRLWEWARIAMELVDKYS